MNNEERLKFAQRYARFNGQPPSLLGKLLTFVIGIALLIFAFMFSLIAIAVVSVGGLLFWGWLQWKSRQIIRQTTNAERTSTQPRQETQVIEGEYIRHDD